MSLFRQLTAQFDIVLDDAIVHHGQYTCAVGMRMRVDIVGAAMRGPTCMTNTQRTLARTRTILDGTNEVGNFARTSAQFERAGSCEDGYPCRVVAAIFEFTQAIKQYGSNVAARGADVADDTAHRVGYPFNVVGMVKKSNPYLRH